MLKSLSDDIMSVSGQSQIYVYYVVLVTIFLGDEKYIKNHFKRKVKYVIWQGLNRGTMTVNKTNG